MLAGLVCFAVTTRRNPDSSNAADISSGGQSLSAMHSSRPSIQQIKSPGPRPGAFWYSIAESGHQYSPSFPDRYFDVAPSAGRAT